MPGDGFNVSIEWAALTVTGSNGLKGMNLTADIDASAPLRIHLRDQSSGAIFRDMKRYQGIRTSDGCEVVVLEVGKPTCPLDLRLDLGNHSPTCFEWGYGGSGPA